MKDKVKFLENVSDAALREAEFRYKKLLSVLDKIDDPDFWICRNCKQPIQEGKLMVMPESVLCVHCAF
ncbi:TraR/DksA family transcriptional regulator [Flagellimonas sp.]|uniref:TraR/DksA family transcriptional regulator n=1 Tax=Flagellimonas sp. TaxID=2058762 RepID=UPI003BB07398